MSAFCVFVWGPLLCWYRALGDLAPLDIIPGSVGIKRFSGAVRTADLGGDLGQLGLKSGVKTSLQTSLKRVDDMVVTAMEDAESAIAKYDSDGVISFKHTERQKPIKTYLKILKSCIALLGRSAISLTGQLISRSMKILTRSLQKCSNYPFRITRQKIELVSRKSFIFQALMSPWKYRKQRSV
jgi:hypothetical protein